MKEKYREYELLKLVEAADMLINHIMYSYEYCGLKDYEEDNLNSLLRRFKNYILTDEVEED